MDSEQSMNENRMVEVKTMAMQSQVNRPKEDPSEVTLCAAHRAKVGNSVML